MLSFTRGRPVALALDKTGKIVHVIHVTPEEKLPDIEADDPMQLIDRIDVDSVKRALRLGMIETRVLMKAVQSKSPGNLNEQLKRAYDILEEKANSKLKTEINFTEGDIKNVIPLLGQGPLAFDRSVLLIGPSGSGKSFLAKQILLHDRRKRPVVLLSKVREDPSLKELALIKSLDDKPRLIQLPIYTDKDLAELPPDEDLKGCIVFFDDIDAFIGDRAQYLREYRDALLEAGRHRNITVMSTSHILSNYNKSRVTLNEAEWILLFPPANRRSADQFLKDRMGLIKGDRDHLIARSNSTGRYLGINMANPNLMLHTKGVMLL